MAYRRAPSDQRPACSRVGSAWRKALEVLRLREPKDRSFEEAAALHFSLNSCPVRHRRFRSGSWLCRLLRIAPSLHRVWQFAKLLLSFLTGDFFIQSHRADFSGLCLVGGQSLHRLCDQLVTTRCITQRGQRFQEVLQFKIRLSTRTLHAQVRSKPINNRLISLNIRKT